jgi:hypothetical protein
MKSILTLMIAACAALSMAQCSSQDGASCSSAVKTAVQHEEDFMAEAHRMAIAAEGKKECCKSTAHKPMAKGDKGCCNEKSQPAKFKVFVRDHGYQFFGCQGSATKGRQELVATGAKVGPVQRVTGNAMIG